ncbi:hypothetical protein GCM10022212_27710 [Actimicrobium antarcticum]|uniref:Uncharacterized protein n=1 Tax=Actimicrobium antarcticum TaxID=1051899 RepID=A0ABP7TN40_9BURK
MWKTPSRFTSQTCVADRVLTGRYLPVVAGAPVSGGGGAVDKEDDAGAGAGAIELDDGFAPAPPVMPGAGAAPGMSAERRSQPPSNAVTIAAVKTNVGVSDETFISAP